MRKQTIGCRVTDKELSQIDTIAQETGQSRAEWLYSLVRRELTGIDTTTVNGLVERISAIESRLARLAK